MFKPVYLFLMFTEIALAGIAAHNNNISETILYCFSAYCCLQFMRKDGGADNGNC